jgi:hypothetical protein
VITAPAHGGANCPDEQTKNCNTGACPILSEELYDIIPNQKFGEGGNFIKWNGDLTSNGAHAPIYGHSLQEVKDRCNQYNQCVGFFYHKGIKAYFMKASGTPTSSTQHTMYVKKTVTPTEDRLATNVEAKDNVNQVKVWEIKYMQQWYTFYTDSEDYLLKTIDGAEHLHYYTSWSGAPKFPHDVKRFLRDDPDARMVGGRLTSNVNAWFYKLYEADFDWYDADLVERRKNFFRGSSGYGHGLPPV